MLRPMGMVCTGTMLVLLTGCTFDSFSLAVNGGLPHKESVVSGSPVSVAMAFQAALQQQGLTFNPAKTQGDTIRVEGTSNGPNAQRFALLFKQKKSDMGEQTTVRIEWDKNPDDNFWMFLLQAASSLQAQQQANQQMGSGFMGQQPNPTMNYQNWPGQPLNQGGYPNAFSQ